MYLIDLVKGTGTMQIINWDELRPLLDGLVVTQEAIELLKALDNEMVDEYEYGSTWRTLAQTIAFLIGLPKDHSHEVPGVLINTIRNLRPFLERKYIIQEKKIAPGTVITLKGKGGSHKVKEISPQFFVVLEDIRGVCSPANITVV